MTCRRLFWLGRRERNHQTSVQPDIRHGTPMRGSNVRRRTRRPVSMVSAPSGRLVPTGTRHLPDETVEAGRAANESTFREVDRSRIPPF